MKINLDLIDVIQLLFLILKLCKVIDWSWWWVMSPMIFQIALLAIIGLIYMVVVIIDQWKQKK